MATNGMFENVEDEQFYTSELIFRKFKLNWKIKDFEFICSCTKVIESPRFPAKNLNKGQWFLQIEPTELKEGNETMFKIFLKSTDGVKRHVNVIIKLYNFSKSVQRFYTKPYLKTDDSLHWSKSAADLYKQFDHSISKDVLITCELSVFESAISIIEKPLADDEGCNDLVKNIECSNDNEDFKDVTFIVENKKFTAHKTILAIRSPVFAAMFKSKMSEELTSVVEVDDIKPTVFQQMLRFIYSDRVENLNESTLELFYAADKYQLEKLKTLCINSLHQNLSSKTIVDTLELADLFSVSKLKEKCLKLLKDEFQVINETQEFKQLLQNHPHLLQEIKKMQKTFDQDEEESEHSEWQITFLN